VRIGNPAALGQLWQSLGARVRERVGRRLCVLAADRRAALRCGIPLKTAFLTTHGGLKVRALVGEVEAAAAPLGDGA
jgi:hypothetical protein